MTTTEPVVKPARNFVDHVVVLTELYGGLSPATVELATQGDTGHGYGAAIGGDVER